VNSGAMEGWIVLVPVGYLQPFLRSKSSIQTSHDISNVTENDIKSWD
jgi:hypothetical protein